MNHTALSIGIWVAMTAALVACGDDEPANVAGLYTINLTNGTNGCNLQAFTPGNSTSNVGLQMTQDGNAVTGNVTGVAGTVLDVLLGSRVFAGGVDEDRVHMEIVGTRAGSQGNCAYTMNAVLSATARGDFLEGTVEYTRVDNGNADCAALRNCVSVQSFNGSRPPQ